MGVSSLEQPCHHKSSSLRMYKPGQLSPELQEALYDLRRFLSDEISPLAVSDALSVLIASEPELMALEIRSWTEAQLLRNQSLSTANCLSHSLNKIHVVGELNLISKEQLARYVQYLSNFALQYCPPAERQALAANLNKFLENDLNQNVFGNYSHQQSLTNPIQFDHAPLRQQDYSEEIIKGMRRFDLLLERLEDKASRNDSINSGFNFNPSGNNILTPVQGAQNNGALIARAFAAAAKNAQTEAELEQYLQRLGQNSLQTSSQVVLMTLGHNLPDWAVSTNSSLDDAAAQSPPARSSSLLDAMQRVVSLAPEPNERAKRFSEVVQAAIIEFNDGWLGRAVSMLDVAEGLIAAKEVDASTIKSVRQKEHQKINEERLRTYVESPHQRPLLRKVLSFFDDLSPQGLLDKLRVEEVRNRRRMIMTLLEIHGPDARPTVFQALQSTFEIHDDHIWYFQRNLLHLLHLIPRRIDFCSDDEINTIIPFTKLKYRTQVAREALSNLALKDDKRAEQALLVRLGDYENALLNIDKMPFDSSELKLLLDRVTFVLVRVRTRKAIQAVIEHGLKRQPQLGDTLSRLTELGTQDLSDHPDLVERLLAALAREMPNKLLSMFVKKDDKAAVDLIKALAGTTSPNVRLALEETAKKYPQREFGEAAAAVLADFAKIESKSAPATNASLINTVDAAKTALAKQTLLLEDDEDPPDPIDLSNETEDPVIAVAPSAAPAALTAPAAALSGDLALFGLPSLMQNLADSRLSGVLTLKSKAGEAIGTVTLDNGKIRSSQTRSLSGVDAVYQLLQKPLAGTFQFVQPEENQLTEQDKSSAQGDGTEEPLELIPILLEGMRRYDELQASCAMVPDNATFATANVEPTPHEEEQDESLIKTVWANVAAGATALKCESNLHVDSYRVRRLLAHWVEQGALNLVMP